MKLKVYYSGKDFFGRWDSMREASVDSGTVDDLKTAFRQLKKDNNCAIHIDERLSIFYASFTEFENEVVTVRTFAAWNAYDEEKMSYSKAKKNILDEYKEKKTA